MAFKFSPKSERRLHGVHTDLQDVLRDALKRSRWDFGVSSGVRTREQQLALMGINKSGHRGSMLTNPDSSKHRRGLAADIVVVDKNGVITWEFTPYAVVAAMVLEIAASKGIPVQWGGNWRTLKDGPHFQLEVPDLSEYPLV